MKTKDKMCLLWLKYYELEQWDIGPRQLPCFWNMEALGKRQTAAPLDTWRHCLAAATANLGPVTGPTLRKKPSATWDRWGASELAPSFVH